MLRHEDHQEQDCSPCERSPNERSQGKKQDESIGETESERTGHLTKAIFQRHLILPGPIPRLLASKFPEGGRVVVDDPSVGDELSSEASTAQALVEVPIDTRRLPGIVPACRLQRASTVGDVPRGYGIAKRRVPGESPIVRLRPFMVVVRHHTRLDVSPAYRARGPVRDSFAQRSDKVLQPPIQRDGVGVNSGQYRGVGRVPPQVP